MSRLLFIIKKELLCIRENKIFNLATIASPLFFLAAFTFMLSDGVSFPFNISSSDEETAFLQSAEDFATPNGIHYMELIPIDTDISQEDSHDAITVTEDPVYKDQILSGNITHYINDVNQNTLKNSRNRIDGALVNFISQTRSRGNIFINEATVYEEDVPWNAGFGTSIFVFGFMLAGMFFSALSIICEFDNQTTILLKLSPYSSGTVFLGKMSACLIKSLLSGTIYYFTYAAVFQRFAVSNGKLFLISVLVYTSFICIGMMIGMALKTAVTALVTCMGTAFALWILGDGFDPLSFFGKAANFLAKINPVTYVVDSVKWCYFKGLDLSAANWGVLFGFACICLIFCGILFPIG